MDEKDQTETESLLAWLKAQDLKSQNQIERELETLPEIDLRKSLKEAKMAVRMRIKALEEPRPPAEGG